MAGLYCHRTGIYCHRTGLYCHRTGLYCHRTGIYCHRTGLYCRRTGLYCRRTGIYCHRTANRRTSDGGAVFWQVTSLALQCSTPFREAFRRSVFRGKQKRRKSTILYPLQDAEINRIKKVMKYSEM